MGSKPIFKREDGNSCTLPCTNLITLPISPSPLPLSLSFSLPPSLSRSLLLPPSLSLPPPVAVNVARQFPAGIQLLNTLLPSDAESSSSTVISSISGLVDGALLFVWNGTDVNGVVLPEDAFIEPVLLEIQTQRLDDQGSPYQVRPLYLPSMELRAAKLILKKNCYDLELSLNRGSGQETQV